MTDENIEKTQSDVFDAAGVLAASPMVMEQSASIGALTKALIAARRVFPPIKKSALNPHLGSKFADLANLIESTDKALADHGLVVVQTHGVRGTGVVVFTQLQHESGEWQRGAQYFAVEWAKGLSSEQVAGKASTYGRRYGYQAMLGIAAEPDDDGHVPRDRHEDRAHRQEAPPRAPSPPPPPKPKDTRPFDIRMKTARTFADLKAIGLEFNANVPEGDERTRLLDIYREERKRLDAPQKPPPREGVTS